MNEVLTLTAEQEAAVEKLQEVAPSLNYEVAHSYLVMDNPGVFNNSGEDIGLVRLNWVPKEAGSTQEQRQKEKEQLEEQHKAAKESFQQEHEQKQKRLQASQENFDKAQQKQKEALEKRHQEIEKQQQEREQEQKQGE